MKNIVRTFIYKKSRLVLHIDTKEKDRLESVLEDLEEDLVLETTGINNKRIMLTEIEENVRNTCNHCGDCENCSNLIYISDEVFHDEMVLKYTLEGILTSMK